MRLENIKRYKLKYDICNKELAIKNIFLLYDTRRKKDISQIIF